MLYFKRETNISIKNKIVVVLFGTYRELMFGAN